MLAVTYRHPSTALSVWGLTPEKSPDVGLHLKRGQGGASNPSCGNEIFQNPLGCASFTLWDYVRLCYASLQNLWASAADDLRWPSIIHSSTALCFRGSSPEGAVAPYLCVVLGRFNFIISTHTYPFTSVCAMRTRILTCLWRTYTIVQYQKKLELIKLHRSGVHVNPAFLLPVWLCQYLWQIYPITASTSIPSTVNRKVVSIFCYKDDFPCWLILPLNLVTSLFHSIQFCSSFDWFWIWFSLILRIVRHKSDVLAIISLSQILCLVPNTSGMNLINAFGRRTIICSCTNMWEYIKSLNTSGHDYTVFNICHNTEYRI